MRENNVVTNETTDARCEYGNPLKAIGYMFRHLFDFFGRATRKEFIMSMVGFVGLCCVLLCLADALDLYYLFLLLLVGSVLTLTSLMIRRYHDFGYDGFVVVIVMLLFPLWPATIPYLILECILRSSQKGVNKYGASSCPSLNLGTFPSAISPVKKSVGCSGCGCLCVLGVPVMFVIMMNVLILSSPYTTKEIYSGFVLPTVDNISTCIGSYYDKSGKLPGLGVVDLDNVGVHMSTVQTFVRNQKVPDDEYVPGYCAGEYQTEIPVESGAQLQTQTSHFACDMGLQASDLHKESFLHKGKCKPAGYRYWATMSSSNAYAYCVGYFPSGDCRVVSGTGYARLEIFTASLRRIAIWERYKPMGSMRIVLRPATNSVETAQIVGEGTCWLGHPELYLSDDPEKMERGIQELKDAGWSF